MYCELLVNFSYFLFIAHVILYRESHMKVEQMESATTTIPATSIVGMRRRCRIK